MLRILAEDEEITTDVLGGFCPFWTVIDGAVVISETAEELFDAVPADRRAIDPAAVLELLQFNHLLGDRTVVCGVRRMPWNASLDGRGRLVRRPPPSHGTTVGSARAVGLRLAELLREELLAKLSGYRRVILLLTGGLDSRVTAAALKEVEPALSVEVQCMTWGLEGSRDVAYARGIAELYGWPHHHVPYDRELTWANIRRGAEWGGSEVVGVHLHGMDWFRAAAEPGDVALAASWGDSIGRAEYSSHHLTRLSFDPVRNVARMIDPRIAEWATRCAESDRATAWQTGDDGRLTTRCELDQQENYMRRMIGHAMDYIRQFCPLVQSFTQKETVTYVYSLSPECRTDRVYLEVLQELDPRLLRIRWARTGRRLDGVPEAACRLTKDYHDWQHWLDIDLRPDLEELQRSPELARLGVFWGRALASRLSWRRLVKVASIELTRRRFQLLPFHWSRTGAYAFRGLVKGLAWGVGAVIRRG